MTLERFRCATSGDISDLRNSRDLYADAFSRAPDDYYTGINAAAKSVLAGTEITRDSPNHQKKARVVGTLCQRKC
jgi:hypothetical protein